MALWPSLCYYVRMCLYSLYIYFILFYYGGEHINLAINMEYQEGDEEKLRENEATDVCVALCLKNV